MAVNMYREYRLKFYLNMRHYIIINEVKGETHPHTWEFALDIKFSRNLFVEFNIFEQGLSLIHISEPTRRTPISYAVFCLKKKNHQKKKQNKPFKHT